MSNRLLRTTRWRVSGGLAMSLALFAGLAWPVSGQERAKEEAARPEIDTVPVIEPYAAPVAPSVEPAALSSDPFCAAHAVSDAMPPEGFAERCLGGQTAPVYPAAPPSLVPGDIAYLQRLTPAPQTLLTAPLPTYTFTTVGANSRPLFAMDFDNTATTLYAVDNVTRELGTLNQTTGAFTVVAPITGVTAGLTARGLAFDPTSSNVYLLFGPNLYTLNITTGATTLIGVTTGTVIDISIDNSGQMYGHEIVGDTLVRIDKTTAVQTVVGPTGINANFAQGLDFDASDNTLYGFAFVITPVQQGHLVRFNLTTGAATILATSPEELEGAIKVPVAPPLAPEQFVDEVEPNDTVATAQGLALLPGRVRGNLFRTPFVAGDIDVDTYSFTAPANSRVYAALLTAWSSGSQDSNLDILDTDGVTVIETDANDGSLGGTASNIAGARLVAGGTYYVRVRQQLLTSLSGTIRPYDLYLNVLSGTPTAEVEPNNNGQTPNPLPANGWVSGVIDPVADNDTFALTASAGDTIVVIQDLDPERDAVAVNLRAGLGVFNGFFLVTSDAGTGDTIPSEAIAMTVRDTGTYTIYVDAQVAGLGGPTATYNLSVFVIPAKNRNCVTYTGSTGAIGDLGTTDFTVNVPDAGLVGYARARLAITHPAPPDLDVTLIGPDNNEVFLFDDPALPTAGTQPFINTVLEDEAAVGMSLFAVHGGMRYSPEVGGRMEHFKGTQKQGTWTLRVRDDLGTVGGGNLDTFSLEVCHPAPRPACVTPGPQETTVFTADFEAGDAGFTHAGTLDEWERGLPSFDPITTAHSGTNAWATDLDSNYENGSNNDLISAPIDLTGVTGRITANWWHRFNMESTSFDMYWVEVRQVGIPASARRLFDWKGSTMSRGVGNPSVTIRQAAGWALNQADISDFAGTMAELRFHLQTDASVVFTGIGVDDVSVTACSQVGVLLADLAITKTDGQGTYFPGQVLTYTIVATNAGPSAVLGAAVTDAFPAALTNVTWTCTASAGSSCPASGSGDINAAVNLLPGGSATFTATATVSGTATGPLTNTAQISVAGVPDPNTANNEATDTNQLAAAVPTALSVDLAGNRVYQPNETVVVAPSWMNTGSAAVTLVGAFSNHAGPAGATYTIPDPAANYGSVAVGATATCTTDCYSVANAMTARPSVHWDSTVDEAIAVTGSAKTWTLHIGDSFTDVPPSNLFYRFIETLLHNNVTGGCTTTTYCPVASTTREQMAVFVLVAKEGPSYSPPACVAGSELFADVPASSPFCRWIEELANRGVVAGCGGGNYCPTATATREQMAVFVLKTLDPAINPPACVAGSEMFDDVPASSVFCRWIEELARRGVVTGCGGGNYCPVDDVTREQMSVFLTVTFSLLLYGV